MGRVRKVNDSRIQQIEWDALIDDYVSQSASGYSQSIPIEQSASYIISFSDGTIYARNGKSGIIDYSGTSPTIVINNALDNLTPGRVRKEKVLFRGTFNINYNIGQIEVPNYTILDFGNSLLRVEDGVSYIDDKGILINKSTPGTDIEISNLIFDENNSGSPDGWAYILWFNEISNFKLRESNISSSSLDYEVSLDGDNIYVTDCNLSSLSMRIGNSIDSTKMAFIRNCRIEYIGISFNRSGIVHNNLMFDMGRISFSADNAIFTDNLSYNTISNVGVSVVGIYAKGIQINTNLFYTTNINVTVISGNTLGNSLQIRDNYFNGGHYQIQIASNQSDITVENNIFENVDFAVMPIRDYTPRYLIRNNVFRNNPLCFEILAGTKQGVYINHNYFYNNNTIWSGDLDGTVIIEDNIGYVTENRGTITLANNEYWAHGMDITPTFIQITPTSTFACGYTNVGASSIQFLTSFVSSIAFSWSARG